MIKLALTFLVFAVGCSSAAAPELKEEEEECSIVWYTVVDTVEARSNDGLDTLEVGIEECQ